MTAQTVRLYKEARAIWWPWLLVTAVGALSLITAGQKLSGFNVNPLSRLWYDGAIPIGSILGIPLLATLVFGAEFQHRTLALQLSQPIDRMQLWKEKMLVMIAAVLPPSIIYCIGWSIMAPQYDKNNPFAVSGQPWMAVALALVVATAGVPYWTMVARTTLGSMVLNGMLPYWCLILLATVYDRVSSSHAYWSTIQLGVLIALLAYAALMIWLGRRKFATYQVGGAAGNDVLIETPIPLPRFVQEAFRCRPNEAVLNLVRKECRLMRPVWVMTVVSAITWTVVAVFQLLPPANQTRHAEPTTTSQIIILAIAIVCNMLIAILSGVVPLGEERTSGTHAWHMTLPVSARTQWIVKLAVGLTASVLFGALMPLAILSVRGFVAGDVWRFVESPTLWIWPLAMTLCTVLAFWSACTVNGSLKAALWMFPIIWGLALAGWFADWVAEKFGMNVAGWIVARVEPISFGQAIGRIYERFDVHGIVLFPPDPRIFMAPVFLLLLVQSYFLFRTQPGENRMHIVRALLPGAVLTFVCVFLALMPFAMFATTYNAANHILEETHQAIREQKPVLVAGHPVQLAGADLAKSSAMSDRTRLWLNEASITVEPLDRPEPYHRFQFWNNVKEGPDATLPAYISNIHLQSGKNCQLRFQPYPLHPNVALTYFYQQRGSLMASCN